jgi:hypothetical protein
MKPEKLYRSEDGLPGRTNRPCKRTRSLLSNWAMRSDLRAKNKKKTLQCKETAAGEEIVGIVVGVIEREYIVQRCGQ